MTDDTRFKIKPMDDITFAVLGTGGIGRRALEMSQHKDALTPVAACDRATASRSTSTASTLMNCWRRRRAILTTKSQPTVAQLLPKAASNNTARTRASSPRARPDPARIRFRRVSITVTGSTPSCFRAAELRTRLHPADGRPFRRGRLLRGYDRRAQAFPRDRHARRPQR